MDPCFLSLKSFYYGKKYYFHLFFLILSFIGLLEFSFNNFFYLYKNTKILIPFGNFQITKRHKFLMVWMLFNKIVAFSWFNRCSLIIACLRRLSYFADASFWAPVLILSFFVYTLILYNMFTGSLLLSRNNYAKRLYYMGLWVFFIVSLITR